MVPEVIDTRELREFLPVTGGPSDKLSRRLRVCLVLSLAAFFEASFFVLLLLLLFSDRSEILSRRSLFSPITCRVFPFVLVILRNLELTRSTRSKFC